MDNEPLSSSAVAPESHVDAGPGGSPRSNDLAAKLAEASREAIAAHVADAGPGRRQVPVAPMVDGASGASVPKDRRPDDSPNPRTTTGATFDAEAGAALVDGAIALIEQATTGLAHSFVIGRTRDAHLALEASKRCAMSPEVKNLIGTGGRLCISKYGADMTYAPEMAVTGGLILYLGGVTLALKALVAEYAKAKTHAPTVNTSTP